MIDNYKDIIDLPYPRDDWNFLMKHPLTDHVSVKRLLDLGGAGKSVKREQLSRVLHIAEVLVDKLFAGINAEIADIGAGI